MSTAINIGDITGLREMSESYSHAGQDFVFSHLVNLQRFKAEVESMVRFDGLIFLVNVKGRLDIKINSLVYGVEPGNVVVVTPGDLIGPHNFREEAIDLYMLFVSREFMKSVNFDIGILKPSRMLDKNPVLHIDSRFEPVVLEYLDLLHKSAIVNTDDPSRLGVIARSISRNLIVTLVYQLAYISERERIPEKAAFDVTVNRSRKMSYVREFLAVLEQNFHRERNVSYYADKLCISSKYLSLLVREATGHTAAAIIDQYVITEAKNMLRYSSDTIQQIAYKLNFPNQSAFGKYFKHLTGQSPTVFRCN